MILDSVNKVTYIGNGEVMAFPYPFIITKSDEIKLIKISPDGVETNITSDYYVESLISTVYYPGWPPSQEVPPKDKPVPLPNGWKLLIYRDVDYTQDTSLFEQYPFKVLEKMSDKSTMQIQQLRDRLNRSFSLSITAADGIDMTLPAPKPLHSFRWDAAGNKLELTEDPAIAIPVVKEFAEKANQSAIAAEKSATAAALSAEIAEMYECGVKRQLFDVADWHLVGNQYELNIKSLTKNGMCVGIDRTTSAGVTRVLTGIETSADYVRLESLEPYNGMAYFAAFIVSKTNRYQKKFTITDWQQNGIYMALTISYNEHSLGMDAIVEVVEKQLNNNVYTNATVQVDRQANGSFVIYTQEVFAGQIILTGGKQ